MTEKRNSKLVVFDLETGGLDRDRHAIIQIAAIAVSEDTLEELGEFQCKVAFPESAADPKALELNSYDAKTWSAWAIHPDQAEREFSEFLRTHATVKCVSKAGKEYHVARLAAHNGCWFDGPFIQAWYKRRDKFLPAYPLVLDTCQLTAWYFLNKSDKPDNLKLGTLGSHFGLLKEGQELHDAMDDCWLTLELLRRLRYAGIEPLSQERSAV